MGIATLKVSDETLEEAGSSKRSLSESMLSGVGKVFRGEAQFSSEEYFTLISELRSLGFANLAWSLLQEKRFDSNRRRLLQADLCLEYGLCYSALTRDPSVRAKIQDVSTALSPPKVSVYVPCYNAEKYLPDVLSALQHQSYPIYEIIVVDDGSTDASRTVAEQFGVTLIPHSENRGLSSARNTALAHATGDFIAAIDSDTMADVFWLERMMLAFENPEIVGTAGRLFESRALSIPDRWRERMMPQHYGALPKEGIQPFGCNSVFRKTALQNIGGYDPRFRASYDDMDLAERILKAGGKTLYVPDAICRHLRFDSMNSVLASCYSWRKPGYELAEAYKDAAQLASKWVFGTTCDVEDLRTLDKEMRGDLTYVSLLGIFSSLARDLSTFCQFHRTTEARSLALEGSLLLFLAAERLTHASYEIQEGLQDEIARIIKISPLGEVSEAAPQLLMRLREMASRKFEIEDALAAVGVVVSSDGRYLLIAVQEILAQLQMSADVWSSIHKSFEKASTSITEAQDGAAVAIDFSRVQSAQGAAERDDAISYMPNVSLTSVQQFVETVSGAKPSRIFFDVVNAHEELACRLLLHLRARTKAPAELGVRGRSASRSAALFTEVREV